MTYEKPKLTVLTANGDTMLLEIEFDRSLTALIYGAMIGNTHVELAADEFEIDGRQGVTISETGLNFGRSSVWLAEEAINAILVFLSAHSFRYLDGRPRPAEGKPS